MFVSITCNTNDNLTNVIIIRRKGIDRSNIIYNTLMLKLHILFMQCELNEQCKFKI